MRINSINYKVTTLESFQGRIDSDDPAESRWHQIIRVADLRNDPVLNECFVLLGFAVDEGVKRNHGRIGASGGPASLRRILANLPAGTLAKGQLVDAGTIHCIEGNLEEAQHLVAECVAYILASGGFPIVLGGGHEITYGHYRGLRKISNGKIGVINFDAHLDIRSPKPNGTSGTGFFQIAMDEQQREGFYHYLAIGIQDSSNTPLLFQRAQTLNILCINRDKFHFKYEKSINETILNFLKEIEHLYITVDMDVFAAAFAPGVSAPAYNGIVPDTFFLEVFDSLINSDKLISVDFAELNPLFDRDMCTARLAANLIFRIVQQKRLR
ncbi:formimidoylglutamase [Sphingobacterium shayense]|uniref:formimidoylglutamase n=1 Tax=Sphingobacterium shayense TaxID=626343 RepID=UPI001551B84B|nr:formimidoylglutamase [Sphingobacterium shayense]NQD70450.1 formimidoylglutamase [Sphingobacterium shayense]